MSAAMQSLIIGLLISIGYFLAKKKVLTPQTGKELSDLLVNIVTPALIITSFQLECTPERKNGLFLALSLSLFSFVLVILFSYLYFGRKKEKLIERLSVIFSNSGFMGLPLIAGIYGTEGVFYASVFIIVFNVIFWTYGISAVHDEFSFRSLKNILLSPPIVAVAVGLPLFILHIQIPDPFYSVLTHISNLNTPLAMIVAGISIRHANLIRVLKDRKLYQTMLGKLVLAPVLVALVFTALPCPTMIREIIVLITACPTAAIIGIVALKYNADSDAAAGYFASTTLVSIFSLPLIKLFCEWIF